MPKLRLKVVDFVLGPKSTSRCLQVAKAVRTPDNSTTTHERLPQAHPASDDCSATVVVAICELLWRGVYRAPFEAPLRICDGKTHTHCSWQHCRQETKAATVLTPVLPCSDRVFARLALTECSTMCRRIRSLSLHCDLLCTSLRLRFVVVASPFDRTCPNFA